MIGGLEPVIVFQFLKLVKSSVSGSIGGIPLASSGETYIPQTPIPIYLSERLTGVLVDAEDKNMDIETDVETKSDGDAAEVTQKGVASNVTINLIALKESIGIQVLGSMSDLIFDKVTSKEYNISYLNGAITVFRAKLQSIQFNQTAETNKMAIQIVLTTGEKKAQGTPTNPVIQKSTGIRPITLGG